MLQSWCPHCDQNVVDRLEIAGTVYWVCRESDELWMGSVVGPYPEGTLHFWLSQLSLDYSDCKSVDEVLVDGPAFELVADQWEPDRQDPGILLPRGSNQSAIGGGGRQGPRVFVRPGTLEVIARLPRERIIFWCTRCWSGWIRNLSRVLRPVGGFNYV
jgi:hypothetical protein